MRAAGVGGEGRNSETWVAVRDGGERGVGAGPGFGAAGYAAGWYDACGAGVGAIEYVEPPVSCRTGAG